MCTEVTSRCQNTEEMRMTQVTLQILRQGLKLNWRAWVAPLKVDIIPTLLFPSHSSQITSLHRDWFATWKYSYSSWTLPPFLDCPSTVRSTNIFPLIGWYHQLWQEPKTVSGHYGLYHEGRPLKVSINLQGFFFLLHPFVFNLRQQTLESRCQRNKGILAGLAPPGLPLHDLSPPCNYPLAPFPLT